MPIFYMSIFFPKKKGERHALSKQNAMKMLPYRVMTVAVQRKHIPVGSNEKKGRKSLDSAVKTGEKRRIGNVFFPMNSEACFTGVDGFKIIWECDRFLFFQGDTHEMGEFR